MRVLRLCSVFETPMVDGRAARFDPVGGMQHHTAQLTRALDARGLHQVVLTAYRPGAPRVERIGRAGICHRVGVPIGRLRQGWAAATLARLPTAAPGVDLVHAHLGEDIAVLPLAALAARQAGAPLVVTVHCSLVHTLATGSLRSVALKVVGGALERRALPRADAVIALTHRLADRLRADGVEPAAIAVIPSGADHRRFEGPFADPWPDRRRPRVLYVGRLSEQKGVELLLDAVAAMRSPANVIVVGDGPRRAELQRRAEQLGMTERITFVGFCPHADVPAAMAHADVLAVPSRYEELGSVLVEALHAGLPVVATDVGGIAEVAQDGVTGRLVPSGDATALAVSLDEVLGDRSALARYRSASLELAAEYRWDRLASKVTSVYDAVLAGRLARQGS